MTPLCETPGHTAGARIVIADDHPLVQAALRSALTGALPNVEILDCFDLDALLGTVRRAPDAVDLVLLDLHMPGSSGFAGLFLMQAHCPTVPVAIISAAQDPAIIRRAVACGASGYIPKSLSLTAMAAAVTAILAGEVWIPPEVEAASGAARDADLDIARRFASLSPQQLRILTMIVAGKLNKQIAGDLNVAEQTVKIHVSAILRKLGVATRTQAAVLAERLGAL